ncbi:MAG: ATP-binding protein [Anaerolineae bacterium]
MTDNTADILTELIHDPEGIAAVLVHLEADLIAVRSAAPDVPLLMLAPDHAHGIASLEHGATDYVVIPDNAAQTGHEWIAVLTARLKTILRLSHLNYRVAEGQRRFRAMIERNGDGILIIDGDGIVRFTNPAAEAMFGQPAERLIGEYFGFPLIVGENTELDIYNRGSHTSVIAEMRVVEVEWEGARAHLATLRDVTARKLLDTQQMENEKLSFALSKEREMRALKDRFLTMMGHELRTPLALIQLSYDMLRQYGARASAEEKQQYLENIRIQVQHLTDMIHDVMAISRSEDPDHAFAAEPTDLVDFCSLMMQEFVASLPSPRAVRFGSTVERLVMPIDWRLLRQAITHLLNNAAKFSPNSDEEIVLRLKALDGEVVIEVEDHGIGIPPEDLPRVFEPFHRGSNIETIPGAGLGLAIVAGVVKAHGGRIEIESWVGVGTRVRLILPMEISG